MRCRHRLLEWCGPPRVGADGRPARASRRAAEVTTTDETDVTMTEVELTEEGG